jgi:hypothetical protein
MLYSSKDTYGHWGRTPAPFTRKALLAMGKPPVVVLFVKDTRVATAEATTGDPYTAFGRIWLPLSTPKVCGLRQ